MTTHGTQPAQSAQSSRYHGMVAAMLTPCTPASTIDAPGATRLARLLAANGLNGLFVCSSTGELPLMDEDDRRTLVSAVREGCPKDVVLYAGISGTGPKQSIRYAKNAAADGADVVVVMAPYFMMLSQTELEAFASRIADDSPVPVFIYHHLRMNSQFEVPTLARLADHPNIAGLKDTSAEDRMPELLAATRGKDFALLQGREPYVLSSLQAGASGCLTALAGVAPELHRDLYNAHRRGDAAAAKANFDRIEQLFKMFRFPETGRSFAHFVHMLKFAAKSRGWLDSTASLIPGFVADAAYDKLLSDHLIASGFPTASAAS